MAASRRPAASDRKAQILAAACRVIARNGVRGLRIEELAQEAGVSVALIYYYFEGRATLLKHTLDYANERAAAYTRIETAPPASARAQIEAALLLEFQDNPLVFENSVVWGELWASAIVDPRLRPDVAQTGERWSQALADRIRAGQEQGDISPAVTAADAAERLIAIVNGLSDKWLIGALTVERAQQLVRGAVERELGPCPGAERGV